MKNKPIVLIVDDEAGVISALKRTFMNDDIHIISAASGEQGLKILEGARVDLVISDQNMPGMDGIDFVRQIRASYPEVLTIILTAYADIKNALLAINQAGVYKFIIKPWDDDELRITVKRALELIDMIREKKALAEEVKAKDIILSELERKHPGITKVERNKDGTVIVKLNQETEKKNGRM